MCTPEEEVGELPDKAVMVILLGGGGVNGSGKMAPRSNPWQSPEQQLGLTSVSLISSGNVCCPRSVKYNVLSLNYIYFCFLRTNGKIIICFYWILTSSYFRIHT